MLLLVHVFGVVEGIVGVRLIVILYVGDVAILIHVSLQSVVVFVRHIVILLVLVAVCVVVAGYVRSISTAIGGSVIAEATLEDAVVITVSVVVVCVIVVLGIRDIVILLHVCVQCVVILVRHVVLLLVFVIVCIIVVGYIPAIPAISAISSEATLGDRVITVEPVVSVRLIVALLVGDVAVLSQVHLERIVVFVFHVLVRLILVVVRAFVVCDLRSVGTVSTIGIVSSISAIRISLSVPSVVVGRETTAVIAGVEIAPLVEKLVGMGLLQS